MKKKKILFLLYDMNAGGAQKVLADMVNNMDPEKYEITVMTLMGNGAFQDKLNADINYRSVIHSKNPVIRKIRSGIHQYLIPPTWDYRKYYKGNYDIEVAYMEGYPTKILAHSKCGKKYAWVHINMKDYREQDRLFKTYGSEKSCYQKFDHIFCVSNDVKNSFEERFGRSDKVSVMTNVFDTEKIKREAGNSSPYEEDGKAHIVSVLKLIPRKSPERLIKAARELKKQGEEAHIYVFGDGPMMEELKKQAADVRSYITFCGYTANPYPYIRYADAYLCLSGVEGLSTVVAEAIILNTPVIAVMGTGVRELFGERTCGILLRESESLPKDAVEAISEITKNTDYYSEEEELRIEDQDECSFNMAQKQKEIGEYF